MNTLSAVEFVQFIKKLDGELHPPSKAIAIAATEARLKVSLPKELKNFLQLTNGAHFSESLWGFFRLEDLAIYSEYRHGLKRILRTEGGEELDAGSLVIFCDAMIDAPSYCVVADSSLENYGYIYCDSGADEVYLAAKSFSEFITKLAADDGNMFVGL